MSALHHHVVCAACFAERWSSVSTDGIVWREAPRACCRCGAPAARWVFVHGAREPTTFPRCACQG